MFNYVSTGYDSGSEGYQFSIQLEVIGGLFSLTKLSCFVLIFHCFVFTSVTVDFLILSSAFSLINSYIYIVIFTWKYGCKRCVTWIFHFLSPWDHNLWIFSQVLVSGLEWVLPSTTSHQQVPAYGVLVGSRNRFYRLSSLVIYSCKMKFLDCLKSFCLRL